ncbi:MAG: recombination protein RecR [Firmicutes bacterium]|nr:recombination protein RecR [Bacillota bacterium]
MAYQYPQSLQELINELSRLPGLGPKAAQRLAFHLIDRTDEAAESLAGALTKAKKAIHKCPRCGNYTDRDICSVCADPARDQGLICVVESVADIVSMERSRSFSGVYHVLFGVISPMDGVGPEKLNLTSLARRLKSGTVREVVLATNPTVEGEATALYLARKIKPLGIKVSRIAHGMPVGGSLAYADEATLSLAINDRKEI